MLKVFKTLSFYTCLLFFIFVAVFLSGCQQKTNATTPTNEVQIPDYFEKVANYLKDNPDKTDKTTFSKVDYKYYTNSTTEYSYYRGITYCSTTDSLILKGISNRYTTVMIEISHEKSYANYEYKYVASYNYTRDDKQDITMSGSFGAILNRMDMNTPIDVPKFDIKYNHMPDSSRVTNFYYSIPKAVEEAEWQLKDIFSKVVQMEDEQNLTYKRYFYLPTFKNPFAMPFKSI